MTARKSVRPQTRVLADLGERGRKTFEARKYSDSLRLGFQPGQMRIAVPFGYPFAAVQFCWPAAIRSEKWRGSVFGNAARGDPWSFVRRAPVSSNRAGNRCFHHKRLPVEKHRCSLRLWITAKILEPTDIHRL
jgi:hypothetical protein